MKFELAQKFCERALQIDNDNVRALELTSSLLLDMGAVIIAYFLDNTFFIYYLLVSVLFTSLSINKKL